MVVRALFDTNVIVSATLSPQGTPGKLIVLFLKERAFELILSPAILSEVEAVLRMPKIMKNLRQPQEIKRWLLDLSVLADLVHDTARVVGVCRDPADDFALSAAVEGRANFLVTGDNDLLALKNYGQFLIVTPRDFMRAM